MGRILTAPEPTRGSNDCEIFVFFTVSVARIVVPKAMNASAHYRGDARNKACDVRQMYSLRGCDALPAGTGLTLSPEVRA